MSSLRLVPVEATEQMLAPFRRPAGWALEPAYVVYPAMLAAAPPITEAEVKALADVLSKAGSQPNVTLRDISRAVFAHFGRKVDQP